MVMLPVVGVVWVYTRECDRSPSRVRGCGMHGGRECGGEERAPRLVGLSPCKHPSTSHRKMSNKGNGKECVFGLKIITSSLIHQDTNMNRLNLVCV